MGHHALGPYVVGEDDEYERCPFIPIFSADGDVVAEVPADYSGKKPKLTKAVRATADLLASSFDTLEALKTARWHLILLGGDNRGTAGADEIQGAVLDVIDAAIAKATGGGQ